MARWVSKAEFIDGQMKKDVINLLASNDKALSATKVMQKLAYATYQDSVRICKEICQDLESGMSLEEVEAKPYSYELEMFYYTKKEYVPKDDPHWSIIGLENLDEFLDKANNKLSIKSRVLDKDEVKIEVVDDN